MPAAKSPADIMCLAVYSLAGGKILRGFMLQTVADRLGITWDRAEAMADAADKAGLIRHQHGTVTLTGEGQARGAILMAPKSTSGKTGRPVVRSGKSPAPQAKPQPRPRAKT